MRTLTPLLSVVIAVIVYLFFTSGQLDTIALRNAEIDEYVKAAAGYTAFTEQLNAKIAKKENRSISDKERLDTLVPERIEAINLLVDLEALVKKHNMLFGNVSVSDEDNASAQEIDSVNTLTSVDISFGVIGTYDQFKVFLRDLERSLTIYEVIDLTFSGTESEFNQYELTVRVYARAQE